ncbi:thermonuclease family protein [Anaerococcus degeneri]|uniref:Thermonuclease family protein n=1 Tax=Anaerococcus degeneri TaxID=361500 RepID=A0ABS7Z0R9_9FIRM|nr:thermonuclease family protein [Anaerococcus degeneri]MBP2014718.1 micrococcal nuclease [Anaerococcus degeneri]MCA2096929.1 thermonuclease family protein [Anaerococcus degeneri]
MFRIILALLFAVTLTSCQEIPKENINQDEFASNDLQIYQKAKVKYAVDGDTIWVDIDGKDEKVRFVGVNTPEVAKDGEPAEFMADEAKDFTNKTIKNKEIYLEKDISDRDKYDRLLRYIWLEKPVDNPTLNDIETKTLNGILVKEGLAFANYYKPDIKYQEYLKKLEKSAQDNKKGIWSDGTEQKEEKINQSYLIKGNKNSKVYHLPEWDSYDTVKEKNAVYFETEKEAKKAGFRPAR